MPTAISKISSRARAAARKRLRSITPMRRLLSATLDHLSAFRALNGPGSDVAIGDPPKGARFLSRTYSSAHGARDYLVYIPSGRSGQTLPLVVMLHGCGQTAEDFAAGTGMNLLAEELGFLVAYPEQTTGFSLNRCWNWYRPGDQVRGKGEPAIINGLTRDIVRNFPVDRKRVFIAGLSAGGAMAAIVAKAYPALFKAAGVHSGLPVGAAGDLSSAMAAMRTGGKGQNTGQPVPTIAFHGTADRTVHPDNGRAVADQAIRGLRDLRLERRGGKYAGGRVARIQTYRRGGGPSICEYWEIDEGGHAWAGGQSAGSFTDSEGPNASKEMIRFFLQTK